MMLGTVFLGVVVVALSIWAMVHGARRNRSGTNNDWRNEDHLSRETDGTWSEGSTYSKRPPSDSSGLNL